MDWLLKIWFVGSLLVAVAIDAIHGNSIITGTVFCDQCKDGQISVFDFPLRGIKVQILCPGSDGEFQVWRQETSNWFGGFAVRFGWGSSLNGCYAQVAGGEGGFNDCAAAAGPPRALRLVFEIFGLQMYTVDPLLSQPAEPMPFCPRSPDPPPELPPFTQVPQLPPLPPLPKLPPFPPLPLLPPLPPFPPLPQLPPFSPVPQLPPFPPLPQLPPFAPVPQLPPFPPLPQLPPFSPQPQFPPFPPLPELPPLPPLPQLPPSSPLPQLPFFPPVGRFPPLPALPPLPQLPPLPPFPELPSLPPVNRLPLAPPVPYLEASACTYRSWLMPEHRCYWKVVTPDTKVGVVFGAITARMFGTNMTLEDAMMGRGDPYITLLREGTTALLNSYDNTRFPYQPVAVIEQVNVALMGGSTQQVLRATLSFMRANSGQSTNSTCRFSECH